MFRNAVLVIFACTALVVSACGHQVTPEPSLNGQYDNLSGSMLIRFSTVGPMNFSTYDYQIVIDACGNGTPYPNPNTTSFLSYTFSFNIGTTPSFGVSTVNPILLQYIVTPGIQNQLNPQIVRTSVSEAVLTLNDNGNNNEFTLVFPRALLYDPLGPTQLPCGSTATAPPVTATPQSTASASGTATPTGTSSASPSPVPTSSGLIAGTNLASTWRFNFFVIATSGCPNGAPSCVLDSLGQGGPTDTTWNGEPIDVTTTSFNPVIKQPDITGMPSDPAAQLSNGEIDNYQ